MFPNERGITQFNKLSTQRGSTLAIAIFIIVVMTLIGVALMKSLSATAGSIAYEVLGTRAFHAGQTGLQWQLQRTFPIAPNSSECDPNISDTPVSLPDEDGNAQCFFIPKCVASVHDAITYYQITSQGQCDDGGVTTTRQFVVQARQL